MDINYSVIKKQTLLQVFPVPHLFSLGNNVCGGRERNLQDGGKREGGSKKDTMMGKKREREMKRERVGRREARGTQNHWSSGVCQKGWKLAGGGGGLELRGFSGSFVL